MLRPFVLFDGREVYINPTYVVGVSDIVLRDDDETPLPHGPFSRIVTTTESYDVRGKAEYVAKELDTWPVEAK